MLAERRVELQVGEEAAGTRLDRFLADPLGSRSRAQSLIEQGRVRVDGRIAPKRHLVVAGERIEVDCERQPTVGPVADVPFGVAFEDAHLTRARNPRAGSRRSSCRSSSIAVRWRWWD